MTDNQDTTPAIDGDPTQALPNGQHESAKPIHAREDDTSDLSLPEAKKQRTSSTTAQDAPVEFLSSLPLDQQPSQQHLTPAETLPPTESTNTTAPSPATQIQAAIENTTDPALLPSVGEPVAAALSQLEPSKEPEADGDQNGTDLVRTGFLPAGAESVMSDIKAYTERAQKYVNASVVAHQNGTGAATSFFLNPNVMLRVQSLPILDNLSTQILTLIAQCPLQDLGSLLSERDSEVTQVYAEMRSMFDHVKKVYTTRSPFISAVELDFSDPIQIDIIRKTNLATWVSSVFATQDISFSELNDHFLDCFVPEGGRLLKIQGALFLELKTQAFISAIGRSQRSRSELLFELFPDELVQQFLFRRPGTRQLAPSETDFVDRARSRRKILMEEVNSPADIANLQDKYRWDDFVNALGSYINKNIDAILNQQSRKAVKGRSLGGLENGDSTPVVTDIGTPVAPPVIDTGLSRATDFAAKAARAAKFVLQQHGQKPGQPVPKQESPAPASAVPPNLGQPSPMEQPSYPNTPQQDPMQTPYPQEQNQHAYMQAPLQQEFQHFDPNDPNNRQNPGGTYSFPLTPGVPHYSQSAPTQQLYERARMAATAKSSPTSRRAGVPSQRRPWTPEEESALMAGLDRVKGPHWSQILGMFGPGGSINESLKDRNQVQLKDKARNLKLFFLKSGIEVPYYLKFVTGELKTRAPAQAAKNEARERERKQGEEHKAHVEGVEGMMALAGAQSQMRTPGAESHTSEVMQHHGLPEVHSTEEQNLIQGLAQENLVQDHQVQPMDVDASSNPAPPFPATEG